MVLYSECECIYYFIELTIPFEDAIEEISKGTRLAGYTRLVEISVRGFVAKSTTMLLLDFGLRTVTQRTFKGVI